MIFGGDIREGYNVKILNIIKMKNCLILILVLFITVNCSEDEEVQQFELTTEIIPSDDGSISPSQASRIARLRPFVETSVWNLPMAQAATFEAATEPTTVTLIADNSATGNRGFYWNQQQYSHPVVFATESDSIATVVDRNSPARGFGPSAGVRIPTNALDLVSTGTDGHLHVVQPDGRYVIEMIGFKFITGDPANQWSVSRVAFVDMLGNSLGPKDTRSVFTNGILSNQGGNGTRANGTSAIGGLVRTSEVQAIVEYMDGTRNDPVGLIPHAMNIGLRANQLFWGPTNPDGDYGYYSSGRGKSLGFVWPATEQDYDAKTTYTGQDPGTPGGGVPMGTFVGIPGNVDLDDPNLPINLLPERQKRAARAIAQCWQDYGAYVGDRSGIAGSVSEPGAPSNFRDALVNGSTEGDGSLDAKALRAAWYMLRVCLQSGNEATPNGGALGAPRRRALAGPVMVDGASSGGGITPVSVSDDFGRGPASTLGSDWTEAVGAWSILSNGWAVSPGDGVAVHNTPCSTTKHQSTITVKTTQALFGGPAVRMNATDSEFYELFSNGTAVEIRRTGGAGDVTVATGTMATPVSGTVLQLVADGDTLVCYRDGTEVLRGTDANSLQGKYVGICSTTNRYFDDFSGGDF